MLIHNLLHFCHHSHNGLQGPFRVCLTDRPSLLPLSGVWIQGRQWLQQLWLLIDIAGHRMILHQFGLIVDWYCWSQDDTCTSLVTVPPTYHIWLLIDIAGHKMILYHVPVWWQSLPHVTPPPNSKCGAHEKVQGWTQDIHKIESKLDDHKTYTKSNQNWFRPDAFPQWRALQWGSTVVYNIKYNKNNVHNIQKTDTRHEPIGGERRKKWGNHCRIMNTALGLTLIFGRGCSLEDMNL